MNLAGDVLETLHCPTAPFRENLVRIYGEKADLAGRIALVKQGVEGFIRVFGDKPVRIFRAPGRINLRGMHVDTHGGYLNLMTHQREVLVVAASTEDSRCKFANTCDQHQSFELDLCALDSDESFRGPWLDFIVSPPATAMRDRAQTDWQPYVQGALYRMRREFLSEGCRGIEALVASDLPEGSGLSSSAALCSVLQLAFARMNGHDLPREDHIRLARDGEWFTGARTGLADQSAIWLGMPGKVHQLVITGDSIHTGTMQEFPWPGELALFVVQSFTKRNLSGSHRLAYTRNRFAYSMAIAVLQESLRSVMNDPTVAFDFLSDWPPIAGKLPGSAYEVLAKIPENASLDSLRTDFTISGLEEAYDRYFGALPEAQRPDTVPLRGPLLFGLAESERARVFLDALRNHDFSQAASLMNRGHDGDRQRNADGSPFLQDIGETALMQCAAQDRPLADCPGVYGASSPVLDALVDTALGAGALGACLTGAGLAGSILAFCPREQAAAVREALAQFLRSSRYEELTGHAAPSEDQISSHGILENCATAGACEISV